MNYENNKSHEAEEAELKQVLQNFRESVHAWSEAEYARPRTLKAMTAHHTWKWALTWATGCVLAMGGLGVGIYEHQRQQAADDSGRKQEQQKQVTASAAQPRAAENSSGAEASARQTVKAETAEPEFNLLAAVDSDVSRQVPSAMEPLAQLMEGELSQ